MELSEKQIQRFWSKINIKGDDDCWEWTGATTDRGYGFYCINRLDYQLKSGAHRVAYMLFNGDFPTDYCCHSCDNPPCCNPKHLFNGTPTENMRDMYNKKRNVNSGAKLTEEQVINIRKEYKCPAPRQSNINELALKYDVSYQTIHYIIKRITWKDI